MKCEKARQMAERPRRPCWRVKAGHEKVLLRTEKLLEKAERKQVSKKNDERNVRLEESYEGTGIRSLRAREAVLKLWHAFSPPWMVVERHILRPHPRPSYSEGLGWDSSKNSHLRYQSGTNEGCGWRKLGGILASVIHTSVVLLWLRT